MKEERSLMHVHHGGRARRVAAAAALSGLLAFATLGALAAGGAAAATKPVLTVGLSQPGPNLNSATDGGLLLFMTSESLITLAPSKTGAYIYRPGLATSWHYVKGTGNQSFVLTLRKNVRFSTGEPVNAAAVAKWLRYWAKSSPYSTVGIGVVKSITTPNRYTVRINLKDPNPTLPFGLARLSGFVSAPSCVDNPKLLNTKSCGAGEYMTTSQGSIAGEQYTLVPNPYYYDKSQVRFSKVVARFISNPSSMLQAMEAGQIDVAAGDGTTVAAAKSAGYHVLSIPGTLYFYNLDVGGTQTPALKNPLVRQALNYAIDRKAITTALVGKNGKPAFEMALNDSFNPKYAHYYKYDPAKAKALLAAAGYKNGLTINSAAIIGSGTGTTAPLAAMTQLIAKYFSAVGVTLNYTAQPTLNSWEAQVSSKTAPGALIDNFYQLAFPTWAFMQADVQKGSFFNHANGGWTDNKLNQIFDRSERAANPAPYLQQITARFTTQAEFLPIMTTNSYFYATKSISGLTGPNADIGQFIIGTFLSKK
jgi:peptide/nickel transport system substrate-binding protein